LNLRPGALVWTGMNDRGLVIDEGEARRLDTSGDERANAFAGLADRHLARAYRLATVILGGEVEAQDAVQDAAVSAWERFGDLRDRERFDAWFDRILVNGCRDRLRRRGRVRLIDMDGAPEPASSDGSGSVAERDALRGALAGLSPEQRVTVVLRYYGDLSLEEIADRTGERLGTVKSRLHYGLGALRAAYDAASRLPGEASR
jgi:RNA polymerase sigma-70 factor (ECF subfamily)